MKKKIWMLVSIGLLALCLTACGKNDSIGAKDDPRTYDYGSYYSYDKLKDDMQGIISNLDLYTDEELDIALSQISQEDDPLNYELITTFQEAREGQGKRIGFGEMNVTIEKDVMTLDLELIYPDSTLFFTLVCDYAELRDNDGLLIEAASVNRETSLGDTMAKAGMNTLMGMGLVFIILIAISLVIYCFRLVPYLENRKKQAQQDVIAVPTGAAQAAVQPTENLTDDLELVAVISAAIAAATGSSADGFVVRSIKRR
ncbi:MAG: OadG family protein [Lachnospiraceae bacterium]|nr:OadG family protein [Lachnospiraceae bacterium]